jgi:DNA-binding transcriptional ArsR family regulator
MPTDAVVSRAASDLRLLADPTRLRILWALMQGESNVGCLADLAGVTPTSVSQHLAKLRLAGLVSTRRQGTFVFYSIPSPWVATLLTNALDEEPAPQRSARASRRRAPSTNQRT